MPQQASTTQRTARPYYDNALPLGLLLMPSASNDPFGVLSVL